MSSDGVFRVHALVLPEGELREIFVAGGRFAAGPVAGATTLVEDAVVVPGLVDVHAHLALRSPAGDAAAPEDAVRASAAAHLDAGVLAVREPGSPHRASSGIGADEPLPHVVTAGRFLARPGTYFPGLALEVDDEGLPDAAAGELRASGAWAKVIADSPLGDDLHRTYGDDCLAEAARRVHELGGRIAAHCVLPETVDAVVRAGFDSVEHGSLMRPDQLGELAARDVTWVPTLAITDSVRGLVRQLGYAPAACQRVDEGLDRQPEVVAAAVDAGVRVLAGTDAGMVPHGIVATEVELLVAAGVPPRAALGAGSWTARAWLGLPGIEPGAPADLVVYRTNPEDDVAALREPVLVVRAGRVVRRTVRTGRRD